MGNRKGQNSRPKNENRLFVLQIACVVFDKKRGTDRSTTECTVIIREASLLERDGSFVVGELIVQFR